MNTMLNIMISTIFTLVHLRVLVFGQQLSVKGRRVESLVDVAVLSEFVGFQTDEPVVAFVVSDPVSDQVGKSQIISFLHEVVHFVSLFLNSVHCLLGVSVNIKRVGLKGTSQVSLLKRVYLDLLLSINISIFQILVLQLILSNIVESELVRQFVGHGIAVVVLASSFGVDDFRLVNNSSVENMAICVGLLVSLNHSSVAGSTSDVLISLSPVE